MPHRIVLFDALQSLRAGHYLVKMGDMALGMRLDGVPEVSHVYRLLRKYNYIKIARTAGPPRSPISYYTITQAGLDGWAEGWRWYHSLPLHLRVWGRLGLPLPC